MFIVISWWILQMTVYLPGFLSVRAKEYSLDAYDEWNFLTPLGPFFSLTSWTSPGLAGHFQTTLVLLATLRWSGAKKLSPILTVFAFAFAALPACESATGATVRAARVRVAAAVLLLKSFLSWMRTGAGPRDGPAPTPRLAGVVLQRLDALARRMRVLDPVRLERRRVLRVAEAVREDLSQRTCDLDVRVRARAAREGRRPGRHVRAATRVVLEAVPAAAAVVGHVVAVQVIPGSEVVPTHGVVAQDGRLGDLRVGVAGEMDRRHLREAREVVTRDAVLLDDRVLAAVEQQADPNRIRDVRRRNLRDLERSPEVEVEVVPEDVFVWDGVARRRIELLRREHVRDDPGAIVEPAALGDRRVAHVRAREAEHVAPRIEVLQQGALLAPLLRRRLADVEARVRVVVGLGVDHLAALGVEGVDAVATAALRDQVVEDVVLVVGREEAVGLVVPRVEALDGDVVCVVDDHRVLVGPLGQALAVEDDDRQQQIGRAHV